MNAIRFGSLVLALLCVVVVGCGSNGNQVRTTKLTAHVVYKGKPVTAGIVKLMNEDGTFMGTGSLSSEGKAEIGIAPVGKVKVVVETKMFETLPPVGGGSGKGDAARPKAGLEGPRPGAYRKLPAKYESAATSTHFEEIAEDQKEITITLTD